MLGSAGTFAFTVTDFTVTEASRSNMCIWNLHEETEQSLFVDPCGCPVSLLERSYAFPTLEAPREA